MLNATKQYSNAQADPNEQATGASEKYDAAIKKIERLENELSQKTYELNQNYKAYFVINESVKNCVESLYTVQNQLQGVAAHLDHSNKRIFELTQKNKALKSSSNEWLKRAIKLEFEALATKDKLKKIENERDLALKVCELLQAELMLNNQQLKK